MITEVLLLSLANGWQITLEMGSLNRMLCSSVRVVLDGWPPSEPDWSTVSPIDGFDTLAWVEDGATIGCAAFRRHLAGTQLLDAHIKWLRAARALPAEGFDQEESGGAAGGSALPGGGGRAVGVTRGATWGARLQRA